jgi:hypothetical protein
MPKNFFEIEPMQKDSSLLCLNINEEESKKVFEHCRQKNLSQLEENYAAN